MEKTLAPSVTTRDSKGRKFIDIVSAAYNKAELSEEEAQRVNDTPGLAVLVGDFITRNRQPDQFANEEVRSSYTYPPEYKGPRPINDQIKAIAEIFSLDPSHALKFANPPTGGLPTLPEGAEGWFAIPSVEALAKKHFPGVTDPAQMYCQAVQLVHAKIAASRSFYNYREGQITPAQLRVHARTAHALDLIAETQKGDPSRQGGAEADILIVAAQLGMRHRGKSVRRAREVFVANEFGLGSLAVGSIVLTHPERLVRWEELQMDCAGDEFSFDAVGSFQGAPFFVFHVGEVRFGAGGVSGFFGGSYGSASGFLTQ